MKEGISKEVTEAIEKVLEKYVDEDVSYVHLIATICKEGHVHTGCHTYSTSEEHQCYGDKMGTSLLHKVVIASSEYYKKSHEKCEEGMSHA